MKRPQYRAVLSGRIKLTDEQMRFIRDRTEPFLDRFGMQTRPIGFLLQEAYLQGLLDCTQALEHRIMPAEPQSAAEIADVLAATGQG